MPTEECRCGRALEVGPDHVGRCSKCKKPRYICWCIPTYAPPEPKQRKRQPFEYRPWRR